MENTTKIRRLACGIAVGALAMAPLAGHTDKSSHRRDKTAINATAPVAISGTVLRYYVDRTGYVTAADIKTADGVDMVRFGPSMGQNIYNTYAIGQPISLYASGSDRWGWDVISLGSEAPLASARSTFVSSVTLLESQPTITIGTRMRTVNGKLTDIITNRMGDVLGLVLNHTTLVRVPLEVRNIDAGAVGTDRVAALFKGAWIEATGYPESPLYGAISAFGLRLAANTISVNGKTVGSVGVQMMGRYHGRSLFNGIDIAGVTRTPEETRARGMGYTLYVPVAPPATM